MPIYRCNACTYVSEETGTSTSGSKIPCGRCGAECSVYEAAFYVEKLVERYYAALRENKALRRQYEALTQAEDATATVAAPVAALPVAPLPMTAQAAVELPVPHLQNTAQLATEAQHAPLKAWFAARQIAAQFDFAAVDTTGFFDDAALRIGDGFGLFAELIERVCFAYRKSHTVVSLELASLSQKDAQAITQLCRELYGFTFFARYTYQKPEKIVRLTLQTAPNIRAFFEGGWLEWYVFVKTAGQQRTNGRAFSCARSVKVTFANDDLHELDVMCLPEGQAPICIECKSGEFRRDIDKYLRLRKRLGLPRNRFIICAADLSDEHANGLSAMYELSFVNLQTLPAHLAGLGGASTASP